MAKLFAPKEHGGGGFPTGEHLEFGLLARLGIEIYKSGFMDFATEYFDRVDTMANEANRDDHRETEIIDSHLDKERETITYYINQISLQALVRQEPNIVTIKVEFSWGEGAMEKMKIIGADTYYDDDMPFDFADETQTVAVIQALDKAIHNPIPQQNDIKPQLPK